MVVPKEILIKCLEQKQQAQFELFKICYPEMMRICDRYHKNEADAKHDINECFLKVLTKLNTFDMDRNFYAWMKQVLVRTIIDNFRKRKNSLHLNFEEIEVMYGNADAKKITWNEADLKCDADEILDMVKSLPDASRKIFNLYSLEGYSHAEISEMLEISVGTSKWHLHNARQKLKNNIYELEKAKRASNYAG